MNIPQPPEIANSSYRTNVCEQCSAHFEMTRSDQRFCSDLCRLRRWRTLRKTRLTPTETTRNLVDALRADVARLESQTAELRQANAALRQQLKRLQTPQSFHRASSIWPEL